METLLKTRSLRFWIALSMLVALAPLAVSALGGYLLLNHGVLAAFQDVASRQAAQIIPTQNLRLLIWDAVIPVDEFMEDGNPAHPLAFRELRTQIETEFAAVEREMIGEPAVVGLVQRARNDWTIADRYATELISVPVQPGDAEAIETVERFHGEIVATSDRLAAVLNQLEADIENDHASAALFFERSIWLAGIAGGISLLAVVFGVFMIGRILATSVDRLVDGAVRFAEGDRAHRIQVQVPPELHQVAEEFNHMIGRIHESEAMLADLAHRDGLTGLSNRRAFDQAMAEMWSRIQRFDEQGAMLTLDIDHFKRINDTHGHVAGDQVLREVARVMTANVRPLDRVFRVGGEEFAVLLPRTERTNAREAGERLRRAVAAALIRFRDVEINATVSVGVAMTSDVVEPQALVEAADAALYRAKAEGRNRVVASIDDDIKVHDAA